MGKNVMSFDECMEELSDIVRNKKSCSAAERMKAISILIQLKNDKIKHSENNDGKFDDSLNITINYGDENL